MTPRPRGSMAPRLTGTVLREIIGLHTLLRRGSDEACDFCRGTVTYLDSEFEVEAQFEGSRLLLHFHPWCFNTWKEMVAPVLQSEL